MKRLLLLILILNSMIGFNQQIDSLYVSTNSNPNIIDVRTVVLFSNHSNYVDHSHFFSHDTLFLDICYEIGPLTSPVILTNTFSIPVPGVNDSLHLKVRVNRQTTPNCLTSLTTDSIFIGFPFPLLENIALTTSDNKWLSADVYPNPAQNQLTINTDGKTIESIQLFNVLGEKIMERNSSNSKIDLLDIQNGIYFLVVKTNEGILKKKIVVSK